MTDRKIANLGDKTGVAEALFAEIRRRSETEGAKAYKIAAEAAINEGNLAFLHDTHKAMRLYARATELDPENPEGWNRLGQLQLLVGDLAAAEASFGRVLALGNSKQDKVIQGG